MGGDVYMSSHRESSKGWGRSRAKLIAIIGGEYVLFGGNLWKEYPCLVFSLGIPSHR